MEAQIANCRQLAEKEKLQVVGVFKDLNTSGETYPVGGEDVANVDQAYKDWVVNQSVRKTFRAGLGEVISLLSEIDVVIVNELTRLYRPINGGFPEGFINEQLKRNNVKVLKVQGGALDLTKFDQQLITMIKNQILYDDLQKKRANSILAFKNKRDSGKLCTGCRCYGIRYLGNDKIEVIPEWVEIIRFIYNSVWAQKSYRSIIRDCNERWGKGQELFFYESSIYSIAKQPLYAGYQYNSNNELIKNVQMTGQEIIPFGEWQAVQKIVAQKRQTSNVGAHKNWLPLSSRLTCGACGGKLTISLDHKNIYYICNKQSLDRAHHKCKASRIRFETGGAANLRWWMPFIRCSSSP